MMYGIHSRLHMSSVVVVYHMALTSIDPRKTCCHISHKVLKFGNMQKIKFIDFKALQNQKVNELNE